VKTHCGGHEATNLNQRVAGPITLSGAIAGGDTVVLEGIPLLVPQVPPSDDRKLYKCLATSYQLIVSIVVLEFVFNAWEFVSDSSHCKWRCR